MELGEFYQHRPLTRIQSHREGYIIAVKINVPSRELVQQVKASPRTRVPSLGQQSRRRDLTPTGQVSSDLHTYITWMHLNPHEQIHARSTL